MKERSPVSSRNIVEAFVVLEIYEKSQPDFVRNMQSAEVYDTHDL